MKKVQSQENRTILIALCIVCLVVAVIFLLYTQERKRQEEVRQTERESLDLEADALESLSSGSLDVLLYFYTPEIVFEDPELFLSDTVVTAEERTIFDTDDITLTARQIIHEVLKGPDNEDGLHIFSEDARLRQIYLQEDGTALVDLAQGLLVPDISSVGVELAAIYSITRSLTSNIAEIRRIKFLVEGRERPTLAGHVSIQEPFM